MSPFTGEALSRIAVGEMLTMYFFKLSFKLFYRLLQFLNPDPLRADGTSDLHQVLQTLRIEDESRETTSGINTPFSLQAALGGFSPSPGFWRM